MARTVEVTPGRWMPRGEALVEAPGKKQLVVWGGIPGEKAVVRIGHQGQHQSYGEWVSSARRDPHRVTPACDRYDPCGGCPLMHLDAAGQVDARRGLVRRALDREELGDVALGAFVPCPDGAAGFRHVIKVGFGRSESGRIKVGAWGRGSRDVVPIPNCVVAAPILRRTMVSLAHHTIALEVEPYDGVSRGILRAAVMRASRTTGEVMVTLIAARRDPILGELAEELARGVNEVVGVWLHLNDGAGNAIFQRDDQGVVGVSPLGGKGWIEERLDGIAYRIGPGDFFQTNPAVAEVLYQRTLERLDLHEGDAVVDLYCGVGGMTLPAARKTGFALGIEEVDGATERAREAARLNRVPAEFVVGPVLAALPEITPRLAGTAPKVIVDPARRGLEPGVVEGILSLQPSRVAYVSCNPVAMARDLAVFRRQGWRIGEIEMFDMFPNTPHVECMVTLDPPEGTAAATRRGPQRRLVR